MFFQSITLCQNIDTVYETDGCVMQQSGDLTPEAPQENFPVWDRYIKGRR